jgi:hypothetical protein
MEKLAGRIPELRNSFGTEKGSIEIVASFTLGLSFAR